MASVVLTSTCRQHFQCFQRNIIHTVLRSQRQGLGSDVRHSKLRKFEKKLEFETDTGVKQDVLLYSYPQREKSNLFYSVGSIFIGICCLNSAHLIYTTMKNLQPPVQTDGRQPWYMWWQGVYTGNDFVPKTLALIIILTGVAVIWVTNANMTHQVKTLTLLRGGEKILMEHYAFLGRTVQKEIPLKEISAANTKSPKEYFPLKVKGNYLNYYIDQNGTFHDRKLFNSTVALQRF